MASRLVSDLSNLIIHPHIDHTERMRRSGIEFVVSCTYRSKEEQLAEWKKGRKFIGGIWVRTGRIATKAKPGQSAHNVTKEGKPWSLAYDILLFKNGKVLENADHPDWQLAIQHGKDCGLENLYPMEACHFQLKNWRKYIPINP